MKSRADWQLETSLLRELVDTVTQRSTIVENMETDRLRFDIIYPHPSPAVPHNKGVPGISCGGQFVDRKCARPYVHTDIYIPIAGSFKTIQNNFVPRFGEGVCGSACLLWVRYCPTTRMRIPTRGGGFVELWCQLTELNLYVPLDTKQVISEKFFP